MKTKKIKDILKIAIPITILLIISLLNMFKVGSGLSMYANYFKKQSLWFILGFLVMGGIFWLKPRIIFKYSKYLYLVNVIMLLLVLFLGKTVNGSRAWFDLGFFSFQPSELMKFSLALYLCEVSGESKKRQQKEVYVLAKIFIILLIPSLLVFLEPDTGAIIIYLLITLGVILVYKIKKKWYLIILLIISLSLGSFLYLYYFNKDLLIKLIGTSFFYRVDRILTFVNKDSFQLNRALMAIGSSSFLGENNLVYIPEAPTDFIIALSISNFGIISFIFIVIAFLWLDCYFLIRLFKIKELKYKMFYAGFLMMFLFAQVENIGMNLGLLPIIGLPLPFLSYGGTNIIVYFMFLGVLEAIKNF